MLILQVDLQIGFLEEGVRIPPPSPTEIQITVQERKSTVWDSAVCQAIKIVNKLNTYMQLSVHMAYSRRYCQCNFSQINLSINVKSLQIRIKHSAITIHISSYYYESWGNQDRRRQLIFSHLTREIDYLRCMHSSVMIFELSTDLSNFKMLVTEVSNMLLYLLYLPPVAADRIPFVSRLKSEMIFLIYMFWGKSLRKFCFDMYTRIARY